MVLIIGIVIVVVIVIVGIITMINKVEYTEINKNMQNHKCLPQPIILKNGQILLAQINMSYHISDSKTAKKAVKKGINIFRKLEHEGITELRRVVDNIDNINIKIENDLKNKLSEIGQDLGVEIIELNIKFGDKKDFNIEKNSYNTTIDINDKNCEEISNAKYNFVVSMKTLVRRRWLGLKKTVFSTKINIQNDKLNYELNRKFENSDKWFKHLERKYNSFTEGTQDIYIDDILSIKYKIGFTFALNFYDFIAVLCVIFGIIFLVVGQLSFWRTISTGLESTPINFNYLPSIIFLFATILLIRYFTCKCIEIKYKSDEKIKKIVFPISSTFFFSVPNSIKKQVNALLGEIRDKNQNIKIKKDRLKWIIISYIIISFIIYVFVPVFLRQEYLQNNELSYNINNDLVYCNISFDKGIIVDIINEKNSTGNMITKYVFKLTNGEKIKIEGYNKEYGKVYNICTENYYKNDTNQLFKTNYLVKDNSNVMTVFVDNAEYVYDCIGNKTFKFNFLNNDNIIDFETKIYYKEAENANTLYNFIDNDKKIIEITDDFDIKEFKGNKYKKIEKIDIYISEYGMCYILKAKYNEKVDYLMYIENKGKRALNELDGILLNSRIDRTGSFKNDENALNSFKIICPEKSKVIMEN